MEATETAVPAGHVAAASQGEVSGMSRVSKERNAVIGDSLGRATPFYPSNDALFSVIWGLLLALGVTTEAGELAADEMIR